MIKELTERTARALGLAGTWRVIDGEDAYVLDRASAAKWGGVALFDPVRNNEDAMYAAGAAGLALAFGSSYALARLHAEAGPAVTELYNAHADRWEAARVAIARCIVAVHKLRHPEPVRDRPGLAWAVAG